MDKHDSIITEPENEELVALEEAAFSEAFSSTRGETPIKPEPVVEEVAPEAEVVEEVAPEPVVEQRLIAGLTEEQLTAALGRNGNLQGTVDKMAGRIGQLMQQVEALRKTPPTTQVAQHALDLKLEKLSAAFPELATILREDLQGITSAGVASAGEVVQQAPAGITQEQLDQIIGERLGSSQEQMREQIEMRVLSVIHPDWLEVIKTPQFAIFRDNVLQQGVGQQLMQSEDASFISTKLSEFKSWRDTQNAPKPVVPAPSVARKQTRLSNAVLPTSAGHVAQGGPITEEDAFISGFKAERAKAGA